MKKKKNRRLVVFVINEKKKKIRGLGVFVINDEKKKMIKGEKKKKKKNLEGRSSL